uniref:Proteasome subunit beta n=1 Tax=Propithecus coquereli TaxID=379532 RepID=A0A2K6GSN4_PROCO
AHSLLASRLGAPAGPQAAGAMIRIPSTPSSSIDLGSSIYGGPIMWTQNPMVTRTSVLSVKFEGGVVIATDMLGSYSYLVCFRNISRIVQVNDSTMLGASGDYADFQYLKQVLGQTVTDEELLGDGHSYSPKATNSWLTRPMYSRRSKMNPLWNTMVIGGYTDGESFLSYVYMLGVPYEAPLLATRCGAYLAQPLLREVLEKQPVLSQTEARELVERYARSYNRFQIATVTEKGVEIEGPLSSETNWDIAHMISGFE